MKPIMKEEYKMLEKFGLPDSYKEKLFIEKNIIFCFDELGKKHKLCRIINIKPKSIQLKFYNANIPSNILSCIEYYENISKVDIDYRINIALENFKLFKDNHKDYKYIILTSTGKDSMVAEMVFKKSGLEYKTLFVNTTLDCHQTYRMVNKLGYEILNPKSEGFYQWVKNDIIPSRTIRKCCDKFKEGNVSEQYNPNEHICFITGMRNDESKNRQDYPYEMVNSKWDDKRKNNWRLFNIIKEFTEDDIWYCILTNKIQVNPLYLMGYSRVGCVVACPFQKDYVNFLDSMFLESYYNRWNEIKKEKFIENRLWVALNCTIEEYLWNGWKKGMKYRDEPTQEVIDEFCKYAGHSYEVGLKYFSNYCKNGCKTSKGNYKKLSNDIVALNLKLLGRYINNGEMYCKNCLSKLLGINKKDLKNMIKEFKNQGCKLF